MHLRDFLRAGHTPTLFAAFLYFDISFMVWVLIGALANSIAPDFGLTDAQKGLLVATPILGGAVLRVVLGLAVDCFGGRRVGLLGLAITLLPLLLGWLWATSFARLLLVGFLLGVAGASFAVALPLASRWYPPQYQGLAMGIAGAGNSGTALATFFAPRLAERLGWHAVFALAAVAIAVTFALFWATAKDSPQHVPAKRLVDYAKLLRAKDTWWFCFFYCVTFGGFVGLASFLNIFFHQQYQLSRVNAGTFATLCVVAGSFLRPLGGYLADRCGGIRLLVWLYVLVGLAMLVVAWLPPLGVATIALFAGMGLLGMGNGAVFQLVPQRFAREIGVVTGIVGAAGGIGGFLLPILLGSLKGLTGSFAGGFFVFALVALQSAAGLLWVSRAWQSAFVDRGGLAVRLPGVPAAYAEPAQF
jgi:NNP family nitrate/nitrite transporter-like MFS transporter